MQVPSGATQLATYKRITLYGLGQLEDQPEEVIITHRETDRILVEACGFKNVLALPNGGNIDDEGNYGYLETAASALSAAKRIIIALDNSAEGERFKAEIARRVGAGKCLLVSYNGGTALGSFRVQGIDGLCGDINAAEPYPIRGLYRVEDFQRSVLQYFEGGMSSGVATGWENVDTLYTVMPGEVTVVTGVPNNGKSEWLDALTINLAVDHGWVFSVFSPENGKEIHTIKLVEKKMAMPAMPSAKDRMSLDSFCSGMAWVDKFYHFIVADDETDLPTLDWILDRASAAVLRYGVKGLVIDPWNEIEHQRGRDISETEYISQSLSKLKRFARNHGVAVWIVAHPNKMQQDKDGNPLVPSLYDISGSAHWANKADNGIVIHRSASIDDATEVWIKKVRFKHVGKRGVTKLKYDKATGKYEPLDSKPSYSLMKEGDHGIQMTEIGEL